MVNFNRYSIQSQQHATEHKENLRHQPDKKLVPGRTNENAKGEITSNDLYSNQTEYGNQTQYELE